VAVAIPVVLRTFEALVPTMFGSAEWVDLDGRTVYGVLYAVEDC
jgi:hypothetical protein